MGELTLTPIDRDPLIGRWKKGEVGVVKELPDTHKYDYVIDFGTLELPKEERVGLFAGMERLARVYYFYANELENVND